MCDGMGGHDAGEVASRLAVDIFADSAARGAAALRAPGRKHSQLRAMASELVVEWTERANAAIHRRGGSGSSAGGPKSRMGTTLALALFVSDFVVVGHVGDSRVYRMRGERIERLTDDHVVMAEAKRHPADPRPARKRKFVTRALGTRSTVEPDVSLHDIAPGDAFVLCSDGLTDLVTDEEILTLTRRAGVNRRLAVRSLIDLANRRGGPDNVTVVMAEVLDDVDEDADETDIMAIER
ncbi:MAG: protein phosphatase 2C domain-containing protein [Planctomycetes bacterium]|nr:protein phosphatase 2C domain-containing protein [Planctomycetota bacterium]